MRTITIPLAWLESGLLRALGETAQNVLANPSHFSEEEHNAADTIVEAIAKELASR